MAASLASILAARSSVGAASAAGAPSAALAASPLPASLAPSPSAAFAALLGCRSLSGSLDARLLLRCQLALGLRDPSAGSLTSGALRPGYRSRLGGHILVHRHRCELNLVDSVARCPIEGNQPGHSRHALSRGDWLDEWSSRPPTCGPDNRVDRALAGTCTGCRCRHRFTWRACAGKTSPTWNSERSDHLAQLEGSHCATSLCS